MHYLLAIIIGVMFLFLPPSGKGWVVIPFVILTTLAVKISGKLITKSTRSFARSFKIAIYISAAAAIFIAFGIGASVSSPLGKILAKYWQAGEPYDCRQCPDNLFIIICDADKGSDIKNLHELSTLRKDYSENRQDWNNGNNDKYSCIKNDSFRLSRRAGSFGGPYDEGDPWFRRDVSFQVVEESAAEQIVEVRYHDSMQDIADSLFRYQVKAGKVTALESRIVNKIWVGLYGELALVAAIILLLAGIRASWRFFRSRQRIK